MRKDSLETRPQSLSEDMPAVPAAKLVNQLSELLVGSMIVVGVLLVGASFAAQGEELKTVLRSLGLSMFPSGIVTFILSRYASHVTRMLLTEAVQRTIRDRLEEDMRQIDHTVQRELHLMADSIKVSMQAMSEDTKKLVPLSLYASRLGVEGVHLTRSEALAVFANSLDEEVEKARSDVDARVWIVASSIQGFLSTSVEEFDGRAMLERIVNANPSTMDLRIMMTDLDKADLRANQENRGQGEIPQEIKKSLGNLKRTGVRREQIRFYPGTPTVFAIATSEKMLLNPYPYETEAFRCFSLIVSETRKPVHGEHQCPDIYHQYLEYHFREPWERRATEVPHGLWDSLPS